MEKKNTVNYQTKCTICDFPLVAEAKNGWFEHVVQAEHLLLRNNYSCEEMQSMGIFDGEDYKDILYRLVDLHSYFETALQDSVINDEISDFTLEDLNNSYETFEELRKDIEHISVPKKP